MLKKKKNNKGFTLVELLVVIAIIGILAVVAVPALFKNIKKAEVAEAISYINAYKTAAVSEYADKQTINDADVENTIDGKKPNSISDIEATVNTKTTTGSITTGNDGILITVTLSEKGKEIKDKLDEKFNDDSSVKIN